MDFQIGQKHDAANRGQITLDGESLTPADIVNIASKNYTVFIAPRALQRVHEAHQAFLAGAENQESNHPMSLKEQKRTVFLQVAGEPMPIQWIKAGIAVCLNGFIKGISCVRLELICALCALLNYNIVPIVPKSGTIESEDSCFLSYIRLAIEEAKDSTYDTNVHYKGVTVKSSEAFRQAGLQQITLNPSESISILCGSSFSSGMACFVWEQTKRLYFASMSGLALSCEELVKFPTAFEEKSLEEREVVQIVNRMTEGSQCKWYVEPLGTYSEALPVYELLQKRLPQFEQMLQIAVNAADSGYSRLKDIMEYVEVLKIALGRFGTIAQKRMNARPCHDPSIPTTVDLLVRDNQASIHNSNGLSSTLYTILPNLFKILSLETLCAARALWLRFHPQKAADEEGQDIEVQGLGTFASNVYPLLSTGLSLSCTTSSDEEMMWFQQTVESENYLNTMILPFTSLPPYLIVKTPLGTVDYHPNDMYLRTKVIRQIESILARHGVQQIETPIFERRSIFGGIAERKGVLFNLVEPSCTLRFDFTVPFARYLAQHNLSRMRRYQYGPVFRRDPTGQCCSQFLQFDVDFAGKYDMMVADAEIIAIVCEVLSSFQLQFVIKFNHKKLLDRILEICEVPTQEMGKVYNLIHKLDKGPWEPKIKTELKKNGLSDHIVQKLETQIGAVCDLAPNVLVLLQTKYMEDAKMKIILDEIELLFHYLTAFKCLNKVIFDLRMVRGVDYYTGMILEASSPKHGTLAAGGSYANLLGMFSKNPISAVGFSFAMDRIFGILKTSKRKKVSFTKCYVTFIRPKNDTDGKRSAVLRKHVLDIASNLWEQNIPTEIVTNSKDTFAAQIETILQKGIRYMIVVEEKQLELGTILLKDLECETHCSIPRDTVATHMCTV